jgi:hypothetical protein
VAGHENGDVGQGRYTIVNDIVEYRSQVSEQSAGLAWRLAMLLAVVDR